MQAEWVFDASDTEYMSMAMAEAESAAARSEVPVGAVVVCDQVILARAGNRRHELNDPTGHAEIIALREAAAAIGDWRLTGCSLYVTLEPCPMCVAACRQARLDLVIWGAEDPIQGACGTVVDLAEELRLGTRLAHRGGLLAADSRRLLRAFFANKRHSS